MYQIRKGDTLLGVAGRAYGLSPGGERLGMAKVINADPLNARFHTANIPSAELKMFGGPRISFSPRFGKPDSQLDGRHTSGHDFAVIRIPETTPKPVPHVNIEAPSAVAPPARVPVRAELED
jgi:hypothetical protein